MKKLQGLNIIKIISTILIVCHHYQLVFYFWMDGKVNFANGNFFFGYIVELFFMISGILAYHTYIERGKEIGTFTQYMSKKFLRFFPMCFINITFLFIFQWIVFLCTGAPAFSEVPTLINYLLSIFFLDNGWGLQKLMVTLPITWYISVLLVMYAIFYGITYLHKKMKINIACFSFVVAILGYTIMLNDDLLINKSFPIFSTECARGMLSFFIGIVLYELVNNLKKPLLIYSYISLPLALFALIYDYITTGSITTPLIGYIYPILIFIIYPSIITMFLTLKPIEKLSSLKPLDYLEAVSFPVYLWHYNILIVFSYIVQKTGILINHGYKTILLFVIAVYIICIPIYQYIDKPLSSYVKKVTANTQSKK